MKDRISFEYTPASKASPQPVLTARLGEFSVSEKLPTTVGPLHPMYGQAKNRLAQQLDQLIAGPDLRGQA